MSTTKLPFYECQYCGKKLARKDTFDKHVCDRMRRFKLCRTKKGINAFNDYKFWLKTKLKNVHKMDTFVDSKFFNTFIKFQEFSSSKGIPDKKLFIRLMVDKDLSPMMWQNDEVYEMFIHHYDTNRTALEMVNDTLATLLRLSEILECEIGDVLENLLPSEISRLVFERRLSPWVLLLSKKFMHYLHMLKDPSQYVMITGVVDVDKWQTEFKSKPKTVAKIKSIISELDL